MDDLRRNDVEQGRVGDSGAATRAVPPFQSNLAGAGSATPRPPAPRGVAFRGLTARLVDDHLREVLPSVRRALEVGPGPRPLLPLLHLDAHTIGVDIVRFDEAVPAFDEYYVGRAEALPLESETVDLVVTKWVFEHIEDGNKVMAEFARVLHGGGTVAFITPNRDYPAFFVSFLLQRAVPFSLAKKLISRIARRPQADVYRSFYRLSTPEAVERAWAPYGKSVIDVVDGETPVYGLRLERFTRGRFARYKPFMVGRLVRANE